MIKTIFPVNVFVKDYKFSEEFADEVASAAQAIYTNYRVETNKDNVEIGDNEIPFFTKENIAAFPVLEELKEVFREGFSELNKSYEENIITDDMLDRMMQKNEGKLPFLKKGEYKQVHTHSGAVAFAIFYLQDIDHSKEGGKLILRDPAFHQNIGFHGPITHEIESRKNRLVVAPAYVWHEVTPYLGDEDRLSVVINLDYSL